MARSKGDRRSRDRDGHWWCRGCATAVPSRATRSVARPDGGLPVLVHRVRIEGTVEPRQCGPLVWRSGVIRAERAERQTARGDSARKRRKRAAVAGAEARTQDAIIRAFDDEYTERVSDAVGRRP